MVSDCTNLEKMQQFNRWLFAEGIVIAYDLIADRFELDTGQFSPQGLLVELDQVLDDAAASAWTKIKYEEHSGGRAEVHHQQC